MIIALGVKRRPKTPKGPFLDIREYTKSPTTTVGSAIKVLKTVIVIFFPLNSFVAIKKPNGIPTSDERIAAIIETLRDKNTTSYTSLSKEMISLIAVKKPSEM